ncbi:MAG: hypothetical protein KDE64_01055 [Rhodocyclaceae bacterium]|nr:hypothetical protein [Rhodocyclaceae bacterium]
MMEITHVMETLLDKVRKGELALDTERVDACLRAGDVLRTLLGAHRGGQAADPAAAALIRDRLNALCAGEGAPAAASATPLVAPPAVSAPASPDDAEMRSLEVRFVPEPHVAGQRELMSNMLEELARLGSVEVLEEPPPDAQYGQWRLAMCTRLSEADLRGVIDFMAEPRSVVILARSDAAAAPPVADEDTMMASLTKSVVTSLTDSRSMPDMPQEDELNQEVDTKLELARAYEEMGDAEGARELLEEVLRDGDEAQQEQARGVLARLA